ncbi:DUF3426 domain-containing protein [Xanthomonas translucens]|uniref:DUF3426 domain-containing protein n=1 Tax=Xanthomonas campestris pv. translucens TaxID=343 RepID=UPI001F605BFF|nr:DUF3426 domain-containing protein [Xanthomonas translucens]
MPDPSPPRPSLATLLRQPERPAPEQADAAAPADVEPGVAASPAQARGAGAAPHADAVPTPAQAAPATSSHAPDAPLAATAPSPPLASEADASLASLPGASESESESELASEAALEPAPAPQASAATAAPSFMQRRAPRQPVLRAAPWQWIALTGLGLLLALQILIADRQRLGADARWRPWVASVCQLLRCSLPPWREPGAFTMLSREVRPLPGRAGTLQIQATFRNDARWAQAWPLLQLSLADADGRTIGSRVLRPQDYLGRTRPEAATLAPGQSAQVTFQVREPAAETAAFSFDFH